MPPPLRAAPPRARPHECSGARSRGRRTRSTRVCVPASRRRSRSTHRRRRRRRCAPASRCPRSQRRRRRRAGPPPRSSGRGPDCRAARPSEPTSSSAFALWRPGAVRKTSSDSSVSRRASAQSFRTAFDAAAMLVAETQPVRSISSPSGRRTRSFSIGVMTPSSTLATSNRIVFDPTSRTPTRMATHRRSDCGTRARGQSEDARARRRSAPTRRSISSRIGRTSVERQALRVGQVPVHVPLPGTTGHASSQVATTTSAHCTSASSSLAGT